MFSANKHAEIFACVSLTRATTTYKLLLNSTENYEECLDDATVAVQLEPTLIKAIKKGAYFSYVSSNLFSEISSEGTV